MIDVRPLVAEELEAASALPLNRLGAPGCEYLVAWDGSVPVGHAHVDWNRDPPELQDVYVREDVRRRGIATALTAAAEARAAERGFAALSLTTGIDNDGAQRLYAKLGYERTADPPERIRGTVRLRSGPLEVDDTLLRYEKRLRPQGRTS